MLRISEIHPPNHGVTLRLEGRVVGLWVAAVRQCCEKVLSQGRPLQLRLAEVEFLDLDGVALLDALRSHGAVLVDCQPIVAEQLEAPLLSRQASRGCLPAARASGR